MVTSPSKSLLFFKSEIFLLLSREQSSILLLEEKSVGCPVKCILKTNYTVNFQLFYYFLFIAPILLLPPLNVEPSRVLPYKLGYVSTFHNGHSEFGFPRVLNHLPLIFLLKLCWYSLLSHSFFQCYNSFKYTLNIIIVTKESVVKCVCPICHVYPSVPPLFFSKYVRICSHISVRQTDRYPYHLTCGKNRM